MLKLPDSRQSYWREQAPITGFSKLNIDLDVDVAVVGGGICGLSCAYLLKQAGLSVAVAEQSEIGSGTSGRTTGKVTSQHNLFYANFISERGEDTARTYAMAHEAAIEQIAANIKQAKINCDWQRDDHYVYTTKRAKLKDIKDEAKLAAKLGLPASFETNTPLPFKVEGAVKFANQAKFNAQAYINGLALAVNGGGSHVFEHSRIVSIRDGSPATIATEDYVIRAKDIIVATNVPTFPLVARGTYCILEYPTTSYIVAARVKQKNERHVYLARRR